MTMLPWNDIKAAAVNIGVEPCALYAVCEVESRGDGFLRDGRPKILFEGHVFWKELQKRHYNPAGLLARGDVRKIHGDISDILYKKWTKKFYKGGTAEYSRLERACAINEDAALSSASWGAFQILGSNWQPLGYESIQAFVAAMKSGYKAQITALTAFLKVNSLIRPLRDKDWAAFAYGYNGPGYAENKYDIEMRSKYQECVVGQNDE